VVHTYNSNYLGSPSGRTISLRPGWATQQDTVSREEEKQRRETKRGDRHTRTEGQRKKGRVYLEARMNKSYHWKNS
jgi:hypothetical protein